MRASSMRAAAVRLSRSAGVRTVSETTGKSGTRCATTRTTMRPRAVLPDDDSTS